jgi:hypothetical protein
MAKGIERIAALIIMGGDHFFRLKKIGRSRIVYPVHEMGEASSDAAIPSVEIYSEVSMSWGFLVLDQIKRVKTRTILIAIPTTMASNLDVRPTMELFPGMISVS